MLLILWEVDLTDERKDSSEEVFKTDRILPIASCMVQLACLDGSQTVPHRSINFGHLTMENTEFGKFLMILIICLVCLIANVKKPVPPSYITIIRPGSFKSAYTSGT